MQDRDERKLIAEIKPELSLFDTPEINAETPAHLLDDDITPVPRLFARNSGRMPQLTPAQISAWTLAIDGMVERPTRWSLCDLQHGFETLTQTCVIECAGNGRAFFSESAGSPPWRYGAVGCVRWTGVRLRDLLQRCGLKAGAVYTGHYAPDVGIDGCWPALSRGIPIAKALAPETMVAWALNGAPVPPIHGGPLRLVVPGYPGSVWHKWIDRIAVRDREHDGERMTGLFYRLPRHPIGPGEPLDPADFDPIVDMPVKSIVTDPQDGFFAPSGRPLAVRGHAWSGHVPVAAVDVSADGGRSWQAAELAPPGERFAWRRFRTAIVAPGPGAVEIVARARDANGDRQPLSSAPWNPRGYCNNIAHRLRGTIL